MGVLILCWLCLLALRLWSLKRTMWQHNCWLVQQVSFAEGVLCAAALRRQQCSWLPGFQVCLAGA
jgi:hypothetical protein